MEPRLRREGGDCREEDELGLGVGEGVAGERHDDLGREGDAGGLDGHEEGDAGVSAAGDEADEEGYEFF